MWLAPSKDSEDGLNIGRRTHRPRRAAALGGPERRVLADVGGQDFHHWPVFARGVRHQSFEGIDAGQPGLSPRRSVAPFAGQLLDGAAEALVGPQLAADLHAAPADAK